MTGPSLVGICSSPVKKENNDYQDYNLDIPAVALSGKMNRKISGQRREIHCEPYL